MEFIIIIASVLGSILSIILFFKIWGMCNNVSAIRKKMEAEEFSCSEIIFRSSINDPSFDKVLAKAIFNSFRSIYRDYDVYEWQTVYEERYRLWSELCQEYGWQFPNIFADMKLYQDFRNYFYIK
jgi:hypothetical protein